EPEPEIPAVAQQRGPARAELAGPRSIGEPAAAAGGALPFGDRSGAAVHGRGRALAGRRLERAGRRRRAGRQRPPGRGRFGATRAGGPFPRAPAPAGGAGGTPDSAGTRRRERSTGAAAVIG